MKRLLVFLFFCTYVTGISSLSHAVTVTFNEISSNPPAQNLGTPYYDNPISEEYAALGIHFRSGVDTPAALGFPSPLFGGTIFNCIYGITNWPNSVFPVTPPTNQYLGLDKPSGVYPITGIAIEFDRVIHQISFKYRRPGNNLYTYTRVYATYYNTRINWTPVHSEYFDAYVDPSKNGITDADGWLPYSKTGLPEFNLVVLSADKKFAIDNLTFPSPPVAGIPTVNEWGLIVMSLMLIISAVIIMRRRSEHI